MATSPASERGVAPVPHATSTVRDAEAFRVRRFDADRDDERIPIADALARPPSERQLDWIDISGEISEGDAATIAERFGFDPATRRALIAPREAPHLAIHGRYLHVSVVAQPDYRHDARTPWLDIVAGNNVVITHHREPIAFLDGINDRIEADTALGMLTAADFVALLLDGAVTTYFRAVDAIEDEVDALDTRSLRDEGDDVLTDLVRVRREISRLRRILSNHRELFASLASPDTARLADNPDAAASLDAVSQRYTAAMGAVEDSRDVLLGSFDVYMTRTAQRTNEVVKILALATVLVLPGSLVAGLLGMNVVVPLPRDNPLSFWGVVGGVALFAAVILLAARRARWL